MAVTWLDKIKYREAYKLRATKALLAELEALEAAEGV
jgi:hypothetical protein